MQPAPSGSFLHSSSLQSHSHIHTQQPWRPRACDGLPSQSTSSAWVSAAVLFLDVVVQQWGWPGLHNVSGARRWTQCSISWRRRKRSIGLQPLDDIDADACAGSGRWSASRCWRMRATARNGSSACSWSRPASLSRGGSVCVSSARLKLQFCACQ
ncbi:hypothetical protein F441_11606 [Phytophthora nicotianae CJ01A1]|uniref:Uncharacterized protein n=2 Tax=Phytophthora nicotianae TaxID=4792 RepID=W2WS52_PHYNI|nr:hypothetical protein F444_11764 [Phytophthora nicotianae P1976]ETP13162.1 hypothetical protein F441_11606 [Phytophthora nicotianae CJ01A1]